jgi:hypothetical protein
VQRSTRIALAAGVAALTAGSVVALTGRTVTVSAGTPARAPCPRAGGRRRRRPAAGRGLDPAARALLTAEARDRYGRVDAIAAARHAPLPNGRGAVTTGLAIAWD